MFHVLMFYLKTCFLIGWVARHIYYILHHSLIDEFCFFVFFERGTCCGMGLWKYFATFSVAQNTQPLTKCGDRFELLIVYWLFFFNIFNRITNYEMRRLTFTLKAFYKIKIRHFFSAPSAAGTFPLGSWWLPHLLLFCKLVQLPIKLR